MYWLREAEKRLEHARRYVPDSDTRILCEQAHYATEFAIKAVLIAHGRNFATTHDIDELLETARDAGETIPDRGRRGNGTVHLRRRRPLRVRETARARVGALPHLRMLPACLKGIVPMVSSWEG